MTDPEDRLDCWTFAGWEPDRAYRRAGSKGTSMFGHGAWLPAWRSRVTSRETVKMLVDAGITIAVTHFYKGFGIEAESAEWPRLKEFVGLCHEQDVKVWGYVQGRSIYYETFQREIPAIMDWVARRYDGTRDCWGGQYYRLAPCLTAEGYCEYIRRVIRIGLTEIGLDGIHNDNSYYMHCYCDRCVRLFRNWLNAMPDLEERTGLPNADHVLPPPIHEGQLRFTDPLQIAWMEFGTQNRLKAYRSFYETVKECDPKAPYETNPAFPRRPGFKSRLSVDPAREGTICDYVCAENGNLPRVRDGRVFSQAEAYLYADAGGYGVMHTSWVHGPNGSNPAGTEALLWTGVAEEFSYHAALLGNNWLLRPTADGGGFLGDNETLRQAHAEAVHFFKELQRSIKPGRRRQWAEMALLIETNTLTLCADTDLPAVRALLSWLLTQRIPVKVVYGGQPIPDCVRTLLVCQQTCLSNQRLDEIAAFARKNERQAIVAGSSGLCDEWNVPRNRSNWSAWRSSPGFVVDSGEAADWCREEDAHSETGWPNERCDRDMTQLLEAARWDPDFRVELPNSVLVNTEETEDGRLLIHLREQSGSGDAVKGCRVILGCPLVDGRTVTLYSHGHEPEALPMADEDPTVISIPEFQHYALLLAH